MLLLALRTFTFFICSRLVFVGYNRSGRFDDLHAPKFYREINYYAIRMNSKLRRVN